VKITAYECKTAHHYQGAETAGAGTEHWWAVNWHLKLSICKPSTFSTSLSAIIHHHKTFALKTGIFSHVHLPALFQPKVLSITHPRIFGTPFLFLSPHSLPYPSNLLLKPTISSWPVVL